jgi:chromosome segregation ATPase
MIFNAIKLNKALADSKTENLALISQLADAQKQLTEAQDTIGDFMVKSKEYDTNVETLKTEHTAALDKVTTELNATIQALELKVSESTISAEAQAAAKLASIGVSLDELPVVSPDEQSPSTTKGYKVIVHK